MREPLCWCCCAVVGRYVDDVISRIDRMFPEMSIQLSRPNGTSAMLLVSWNISSLTWFSSQVELLSQKCKVLKIFFPQKHIILHLPQQCSIFLALRQISDKNNFPFKQIYCFIVKCDCRNRSTKLKCSLWFLADLAMSES